MKSLFCDSGFATFNPVAASPLIGYGTPPDTRINFSILDYHGLNDRTIPYNEEIANGIGPYGSLISYDGYYYEDKKTNLNEWATAMNCDDEVRYETEWDGIKSFECYERKCAHGKSILACTGEYGHNYPLWNQDGTPSAAIAWNFMKNHPRNRNI